MIRVRPLFALLLAGCTLLLGCGDDAPNKPKAPVDSSPPPPINLQPGVMVGTGTLTGSIFSLAVGDLTGDSKDDVAVGGEGDQVWVGMGSSTGLQAGTVVHAGVHASALTIGDFDGDGFGDLIVAGHSVVTMMRGSGAGVASTPETLFTVPDTMFVRSLEVRDVTHDGRADIFLTTYWRQLVFFDVYFPHYVGTVIRHDGTTPVGPILGTPKLDDVNGDGNVDLVAYPLFAYSVSVSLGNGNGTFGTGHSKSLSTQPTALALLDLDGDGDDEVVVEHLSGTPGVGTLEWRSGSLTTETLVPGSAPGNYCATGDLNGDGKPDLATSPHDATQLSILLGNGAGFVAGDPVSAGDPIEQIAIGDVEGDGKADILTRGSGAGTVRIVYSHPIVTTLADAHSAPSTAKSR